jgi:two-component system CheB/CheR fusion protein
MVIFAAHNLLKDPPFTKIDLITCRNLLIYLQASVQRRLIALLHFALNPRGFLFLGSSESIGDFDEAFHVVYEKQRIFQKNPAAPMPNLRLTGESDIVARLRAPITTADTQFTRAGGDPPLRRAYELIAEEFAPPGFLVNERFEVLHTFGRLDGLIQLPAGTFTPEATRLAHQDLRVALSTALHRAAKENKPVSYTDVRIRVEDKVRRLTVTVRPLAGGTADSAYIVFLVDQRPPAPIAEEAESFDHARQKDARILDLEHELQQTRENLQATIEELETSNEELQSTNEELLASNEELQSTNEELHSVNEELYTVNAEYQAKVNEATQLTNDFDNLLRSTNVGTLFVDSELNVRKFTPVVRDYVNLVEHDLGRPLNHLTHTLRDVDLVAAVEQVVEDGSPVTRDVQDKRGEWVLLRVLPFRDEEDSIEGAVITLIDISELKSREQAVRASIDQLEAMFAAIPLPLLAVSFEQKILHASQRFATLLEYDGHDLMDRSLGEILHPGDAAQDVELTETLRAHGGAPTQVQRRYLRKSGEPVTLAQSVYLARDYRGQPVARLNVILEPQD